MTSNKKSIGLRVLAALQAMRSERAAPAVAKGICLGLLALGSSHAFAANEAARQGASASTTAEAKPAHAAKRVNFGSENASRDARQTADWVVDSGDNRSMPFAIVDKADAKVYVFHADGRLRGAAPVLLGLGTGDDSVPGIGTRKLSTILPEERTTPAGRFVASLGRNMHGGEILWVDYDNAISLHPVITSNVKERRAQRLASATPLDNRISYGCINVPVKFYKKVVSAAFKGTNGIVYVLPETRPAQKVFASYDVDERARLRSAGQSVPAQAASGTDAIDGGR